MSGSWLSDRALSHRGAAKVAVRLSDALLHLGNTVGDYQAARDGQERTHESLSGWWPKFEHRFRPAEDVWRQVAQTLAWEWRVMFGEILEARDQVAALVDEARRSNTDGPQHARLTERMEILYVRMDSFYHLAEQRTDTSRGRWWFREPGVWWEERQAWDSNAWRMSGPHGAFSTTGGSSPDYNMPGESG